MCKWGLLDCDQKDINKPTQRIEMLLTDYTEWTMLLFWGWVSLLLVLFSFCYVLLGLSRMRNSIFCHFLIELGKEIMFTKIWTKAVFTLEEYFLLYLTIEQKTLFCVYVYWKCIFKKSAWSNLLVIKIVWDKRLVFKSVINCNWSVPFIMATYFMFTLSELPYLR